MPGILLRFMLNCIELVCRFLCIVSFPFLHFSKREDRFVYYVMCDCLFDEIKFYKTPVTISRMIYTIRTCGRLKYQMRLIEARNHLINSHFSMGITLWWSVVEIFSPPPPPHYERMKIPNEHWYIPKVSACVNHNRKYFYTNILLFWVSCLNLHSFLPFAQTLVKKTSWKSDVYVPCILCD